MAVCEKRHEAGNPSTEGLKKPFLKLDIDYEQQLNFFKNFLNSLLFAKISTDL